MNRPTTMPTKQKKIKKAILIEPLIYTLHNIQTKINDASGAATGFELRLRIIAQLDPRVQDELKKIQIEEMQKSKKRKKIQPFHKVDLIYLIEAVLEVYKNKLSAEEMQKIQSCRPPRNKLSHGSFVELMMEINGEAPGREIDPRTNKGKPLEVDDITEGAICIERNRGFDKFSQRAREAVCILEGKVIRSLKDPKGHVILDIA